MLWFRKFVLSSYLLYSARIYFVSVPHAKSNNPSQQKTSTSQCYSNLTMKLCSKSTYLRSEIYFLKTLAINIRDSPTLIVNALRTLIKPRMVFTLKQHLFTSKSVNILPFYSALCFKFPENSSCFIFKSSQ